LNISVENTEQLSLEQIRAFLEASQEVRFEATERQEVYGWVTRTLCHQEYWKQKREAKGLLRRYMATMTGLSRAQVTRLIARYQKDGQVQERSYQRNRFARRYIAADIELLGAVDEAHETLSGPATQKILYREFYEYKDARYRRLATISVPHIYNLRKSRAYRKRRMAYQKTRPVQVAIGERRRPNPENKPGYLRIDTVHQGDLEGMKGVYHINAVDEVTQWQVVGATEQISEAWLIPVLEAMLGQFPFRLLGFHSDNGSEFINHTVAKLLNKLLVEQTKSRPRHSNDNGLAEAKNGAVIRKHMGYGHIAAEQAQAIEEFYQKHFNPYLNFHRPCGVPELRANAKGKQRRIYRWYATPWEILRQLPDLARHLRPQHSEAELERKAKAQSDTQAARSMQDAKRKLFARIHRRQSAGAPTAQGLRPSSRGFAPDPTGAAPLRPALENLKTFPREEKTRRPGGGASLPPSGSFFD
jgi:transposase InsO family protein